MQIWRMPPGGYDQQQVTDDEFNNWFPHISPDGKWIVLSRVPAGRRRRPTIRSTSRCTCG